MVLPNTEGCTSHHDLTPDQPAKQPISNIQADDAKSYETLQTKVKMDDLYTDMVSLILFLHFSCINVNSWILVTAADCDHKSFMTLLLRHELDSVIIYRPLQIQQSLKHEMLKQQHQIEVLNSTDANQKRIEESISNLEAENQNMNSRVQQLYMQLLHEIVKKKDIELDSKTVDKKLLNQTVHLYELEVTLWVFLVSKTRNNNKNTH